MLVYAYDNEGYNYFATLSEAKRNAAQYMSEGEVVNILRMELGPATNSLVMAVLQGEGFAKKITTVCTVQGTR